MIFAIGLLADGLTLCFDAFHFLDLLSTFSTLIKLVCFQHITILLLFQLHEFFFCLFAISMIEFGSAIMKLSTLLKAYMEQKFLQILLDEDVVVVIVEIFIFVLSRYMCSRSHCHP